MRSPPSSGMFFSSPPIYTGSGPEEEVEVLLASARRVKKLDQNLIAVAHTDKEAFLNLFSQQVQLIKSRSQAFEDAHVTVYDKVLLKLTDNGNELESPAAITWYCTEYLGINSGSKINQDTHVVELALKLSTRHPKALPTSSSLVKSDSTVTTTPAKFSRPLEQLSCKDDPCFARLWSVYRKAHKDYLALADKRNEGTLEAAKFLRDTAENGIHYLRKKWPIDSALGELIKTRDMTEKAVLSLNGGKKRKFDRTTGYDDRKTEVAYAPHTAVHDRMYGEKRRLFKNTYGQEKRRGRGPSGIPYGYTRPVDSYYPA